jgi:hypothetical protein
MDNVYAFFMDVLYRGDRGCGVEDGVGGISAGDGRAGPAGSHRSH